MLTYKELCEKWNKLPIYSNGFIRVDESHPIDICIGYDGINQKTLLILNTGKVEKLASSKSISAQNFQRQDGLWAVSFRLIKKETEEVFIRLCWDIIEASRDEQYKIIEFIVTRYDKWLKLMEHKRSEMMDEPRQKGLLGELLFLQDLINQIGEEMAIESWSGPDGADQDFITDNLWFEVKSVSIASDSVSISSLEQLDASGVGTLVIFSLDKTTPSNSLGLSLFGEVDKTCKMLTRNPKAKEMYYSKLFQYGYDDNIDYDYQKYRLNDRKDFAVNDEFPKLTKQNTPIGIIATKYMISLSSIEKHRK